jgi:hypothetical protein
LAEVAYFRNKELAVVKYIPVLFFLAYLGLGIAIYGDYGMSWDEGLQREHGNVSARYIHKWVDYTRFWDGYQENTFTDNELYNYPHRYYGVWFSTPMAWLEKGLRLQTYRQYFMMRHLSTFLLYWLGAVLFYFLLLGRFKHWAWALLGSGLMMLSPRLFAHSFYNPKDIPLLFLYLLSIWSLFRFWLKPGLSNALLHGLSCGMLIGMRVVGLIMPLMTLFLIGLDVVLNRRWQSPWLKKYFFGLLAYLPATAFFTVFFWPFLWEAPLQNLAESFRVMSQYGWGGKVLFMGKMIDATEMPWYYIPYWIGISTPILYLCLAVLAVLLLLPGLWHNISKPRQKGIWADDGQRKDWAMAGLLVAPLLAVIVKESVVYDGWRHLFFVYPCLLYLTVLGAYKCREWIAKRKMPMRQYLNIAALSVLLLSMAHTAWWMYHNHPHQNVYFNSLRTGNLFGQYDLDYWGNSYKQGMEALAGLDDSSTIKIAYQSYPATLNYDFLPPHLHNRFVLVENWEEADYYLCNYRMWLEEIWQVRQKMGPFAGEKVYEMKVGQTPIFGIYKLK